MGARQPLGRQGNAHAQLMHSALWEARLVGSQHYLPLTRTVTLGKFLSQSDLKFQKAPCGSVCKTLKIESETWRACVIHDRV